MISRLSVLPVMLMALMVSSCMLSEEFIREASQALEQESAPTQAEVSQAIRQALQQGVDRSIAKLGKENGFNKNSLVRIPLPEDLQKVDKLLRKLGQDKYADEFVLTLNRAAERAVPEATEIFVSAIKKMSIKDAVNIIQGPENAATEYFRRTSGTKLTKRFRPIVEQATDAVGVTKAYKKLLDEAGSLTAYLNKDAQDLDQYITGKASDALFLFIAKEEAKIRENPIARTTEILKKVFGFYAE